MGAAVGGDAGPALLLIAASGGAMALARVAANRWGPAVVPAVIVTAAAVTAFLSRGSLLSGRAGSSPFRYSNANAAFFVQAAVAALILVALARDRKVRILAGIIALAFASIPTLTDVRAGVVLVAGVPALALAARRAAGERVAVAVCAGAVGLVMAGSCLLAATYDEQSRNGHLDRAVDATLSQVRPRLWNEALSIVREHPFLGVGPDGFSIGGTGAAGRNGAAPAHNEYLQHAAEFGIVGGGFLVAAFVWGFARLAVEPRVGIVTVLAAVALAAAGIHAAIDYILHFPAVALVVAAIVGAASASRPVNEGRPSSPRTAKVSARED